MRAIVGALGIVAFGLILGSFGSSDAQASHAFQPQSVWSQLKPPGSQDISYNLNYCSGTIPPQWAQVIEDWDVQLGSKFEFDQYTFCPQLNTQVRWSPWSECDPGAYACWRAIVQGENILTSTIHFMPVYSSLTAAWKVTVPAHEWGHNLGLADEDAGTCEGYTIMGQVDGVGGPCFTSPTGSDLWSVTCTVYSRCGDFGSDGCTDIVARRSSNSELQLYNGNCSGGWGQTAVQIDTGWGGFNWILRPGDSSGDACTDVIARQTSNSTLRLYEGDCAGGWENENLQIGTGWNIMTWIAGPGDFDNDGCADIIARESVSGPNNEPLLLYRGDCEGDWEETHIPIGSGWEIVNWISDPGDFNGDGCPDVLARWISDNTLRLYEGNCGPEGGWWKTTAIPIGTGWNKYDRITAPGDFNGDGCMDVLGREPGVSSGELEFNAGNCSGGWGTPLAYPIGTGWNVMNWFD